MIYFIIFHSIILSTTIVSMYPSDHFGIEQLDMVLCHRSDVKSLVGLAEMYGMRLVYVRGHG